MKFLGQQFGIELIERANDGHCCIQILSEDDEYWHQSGTSFSSAWLDDLINQLQAAKHYIEKHGKLESKKHNWGYKMSSKHFER